MTTRFDGLESTNMRKGVNKNLKQIPSASVEWSDEGQVRDSGGKVGTENDDRRGSENFEKHDLNNPEFVFDVRDSLYSLYGRAQQSEVSLQGP
jgi:hypothetical protein